MRNIHEIQKGEIVKVRSIDGGGSGASKDRTETPVEGRRQLPRLVDSGSALPPQKRREATEPVHMDVGRASLTPVPGGKLGFDKLNEYMMNRGCSPIQPGTTIQDLLYSQDPTTRDVARRGIREIVMGRFPASAVSSSEVAPREAVEDRSSAPLNTDENPRRIRSEAPRRKPKPKTDLPTETLTSSEPVKIPQFTVYPDNKILSCEEREVSLGSTEFVLLKILMQQPNTVVPTLTLLRGLGEAGYSTSKGNLEVTLHNLRKKLSVVGEVDPKQVIRSELRKGFIFVDPSKEST